MGRGPIKRQTLAVLRQRGVPVQTVIDVGVLTGTPELLATYPDRPHLLFEPVAEFAPAIAQAYRNTPHQLVQAAVSDSDGEVHLRVASILGGGQISHSYMADEDPEATRVVPKLTLDAYLAAHPAPGPYFLKVDIDGDELKVLRGATETLKQTSIVMMEVIRYEFAQRVGYLLEHGFVLYDLTEPANNDHSFWQCDAVYVRADLHAAHFKTLDQNLDRRLYEVFDGS
jgi:FkbM family methyltransferase